MRTYLIIISLFIILCIQSNAQDYSVVFYSGRNNTQDIYMLKKGSLKPVNLTHNSAKDNCPAISPDGKQIVFLSDRNGNQEIYTMNIDGSDVKQLTNSAESKEHPSFSPDGKQIIFI
ncbi:MAG: hypothetical protein KKG99_07155 [Bacteroidetes bacterium]|nr:hypothetical protein [Bacteroidota bacterium]